MAHECGDEVDGQQTTDEHDGTPGPGGPDAAVVLPAGRFWLEVAGRDSASRAELEQYVRTAFEARHGASVRAFMPTLLGFRDGAGALRGVAGVRGAHEEGLYLEHYLGRPIEQACVTALAARGIDRVARREIAEIGHLSGGGCRVTMRMAAVLPRFLLERGYRYVAFTATRALWRTLTGLGAPLVELARAERTRVRGTADEWGRYYETDPRVYAGCLADAGRVRVFGPRSPR